MVVHLVLFRPKPSLTDADRASFLEAFRHALDTIPAIRRARVGRRITHGRGYEALMREDLPYVAILEFDGVEGLRAYLEHPAHERLGALLFASAESMLIYDYEIADGAPLERPT